MEIENNNKNSFKTIGCNHTANGLLIGGNISRYSEALDSKNQVCVETGIGDIRYATIGNIQEAYEILKEIIEKRKPLDFVSICECVQETVNLYFGDYSNISNRLYFFPSNEDVIYDGKKEGTIADLAHQNAAMCVERSMLSQNLLKTLNINSSIKIAGFINNDKEPDTHAFNLVENDGEYYIFDSTQPTLTNDVINPLVATIPKDVYDKLMSEISSDGISVKVSHYNPLTNKDYDVIYDAGRTEEYDTRISLSK